MRDLAGVRALLLIGGLGAMPALAVAAPASRPPSAPGAQGRVVRPGSTRPLNRILPSSP